MKYALATFGLLFTVFLTFGQTKVVCIVDALSKKPVVGAHLWITGTELGSFSDAFGRVSLPNITENLEVIGSHLGYDYFRSYFNDLRDSIFLTPVATDLALVELKAKATARQKKYFRQFKSALLGKTKNAKATTILNPEVLSYKLDNGSLTVSSNELLKLNNTHTGYTIDVLLESFTQHGNEVSYSVKPRFTSYENPSKEHHRNREQTFVGSYAHFIQHFINNTHRKAGYIVNVVTQNSDGSLRVVGPGKRSALIQQIDQKLLLKSSALIQVAFTKEKDLISDSETLKGGLSVLGQTAEVDMINQEKNAISLGKNAQVSYIFLPSSRAVLDRQGLPTKANSLVFLGYWNYEGVSDLLPRKVELQAKDLLREKNGFVLNNLLIEPQNIVAGGIKKDQIPALDHPVFKKADLFDPEEAILGVYYNGIAKAYPIRILEFHEIINDQFDQEKVLISYCPLCESGLAFLSKDRNFGVSGLLYNSNLLLYDKATESLWSQILGKAISGEEAGNELSAIPVHRTRLSDWLELYPESIVLSEETGFNRRYLGDAYIDYKNTEKLMFHVEHQNEALNNKTLIIGILLNGNAYTIKRSLFKSRQQKIYSSDQKAFLIQLENSIPVVRHKDMILTTRLMYWFAWYSFYPHTQIVK